MTSSLALPAPIDAVLDAIRRGDVAAFLGHFGPDAFVNDWGSRYVGHAQIRAWSDLEFIGKQVTLRVTGMTTQPDEVEIAAEVGGNGFNGPSHFLFVHDHGLIREMRITD